MTHVCKTPHTGYDLQTYSIERPIPSGGPFGAYSCIFVYPAAIAASGSDGSSGHSLGLKVVNKNLLAVKSSITQPAHFRETGRPGPKYGGIRSWSAHTRWY